MSYWSAVLKLASFLKNNNLRRQSMDTQKVKQLKVAGNQNKN